MNEDLIQRLLFAESNFPTALKGGAKMLASYNEMWSVLPDILHIASKAGSVADETLYLAHSVASRIANLANCFLDIRHGEESSTASLQKDCDTILHQMAALDLNANPKVQLSDDTRCSRSHSNTPISNTDFPSPPFITTAHQWLVDNLHNPYPAAEIKARMVAASSCQVSSVNSWFVNARRRIGWTTICREYFSNCRADMIDAAYRALVEEDPRRTLPPELRHSFVAMKAVAEGLYPSVSIRSDSAEHLDVMVKSTVQESQGSIEAKCNQVDEVNLTKTVQDSYSSPDPSFMASPVPTFGDFFTGESEGEDIASPAVVGSKRRRTSEEPIDQPSFIDNRPVKRLRASMTTPTCLPSPPSSTSGVDEPLDHNSPELPSLHKTLPENEVILSRKRRLSDAAGTCAITQRPRNSLTPTPRFHTVSDSLPCLNVENEYSIDDWFNTNFDDLFVIPPPVDATNPDFSASWEVELFKDYSIPGNPKYTLKCPPAPATDGGISAPTDLLDLHSLLQSIGNGTSVTPLDGVPSNSTGPVYIPSLDSSVSDIPQTSVDWSSLLSGTETYQTTVYSTFSQDPTDSQPLQEIDLSMPQFPQVMPAVSSQGDFASKQAKLHQLHAMQEAVWRMEEELRSEGVVV